MRTNSVVYNKIYNKNTKEMVPIIYIVSEFEKMIYNDKKMTVSCAIKKLTEIYEISHKSIKTYLVDTNNLSYLNRLNENTTGAGRPKSVELQEFKNKIISHFEMQYGGPNIRIGLPTISEFCAKYARMYNCSSTKIHTCIRNHPKYHIYKIYNR